jgi:hypothetical protein
MARLNNSQQFPVFVGEIRRFQESDAIAADRKQRTNPTRFLETVNIEFSN